MIDFLKSTEAFSGDVQNSDNPQDENEDSNLDIKTIEDQFDNILTYHEQRATDLIKALKDNTDTNSSQ